MEARFAGKRALVTGAGSGIGAAVARGLHAEGADVRLADVRGRWRSTSATRSRCAAQRAISTCS
jgi:NAD(P)-dependent dehydrogenase (short-subunit alcohol dehydrogenase family)